MQSFIDFFNNTFTELNIWSILLRIIMAIVFSGVIGLDRESKRHPAGFRTHILVSLASALAMMIGIYMSEAYNTDPARLAAQVISGIGFLGAGTIIFGAGHIRGVTTAAGLWANAIMGLAIGAGFYSGAVIAFIAIFITMTLFRKINRSYKKRHCGTAVLKIKLKSRNDIEYITNLLSSWSIDIDSVSFNSANGEDDTIALSLGVIMENNVDNNTTMVNLMKQSCIISASLKETSDENE
ncbi:MAG: hypothetical protein A2Y17_01820 [Clostridiales bacterium GWF2_38_85]|nr:MAG: hypothetical protein A2Y17_01820 [Clostridiales bacterium GWF2_38_85]HBL84752.1 hypothetical protein [Clostridiales bacterium]